jgi:hypothetical protein
MELQMLNVFLDCFVTLDVHAMSREGGGQKRR